MKPISDKWIAEWEEAFASIRNRSILSDAERAFIRVLAEFQRTRAAIRQHKLEMRECYGDDCEIPLQLPWLYRATLPEGEKQ